MTQALLIVPHFWDPVCVPLGITSLKAYAETHGHIVHLLDLNTEPDVFGHQKLYFDEMKRQFPDWHKWNIERNGTEMLAMHQVLYLRARGHADYASLVAEILNVRELSLTYIMDRLDVRPFDALFDRLYAVVSTLVSRKLSELRPDVVGTSLFNSTWPGSLFITRLVKQLLPGTRTVVGGPGPIIGFNSERGEIERFCAAHPYVDFYVCGEGERPFLQILDDQTRSPAILDGGRESGKPLPIASLPPPSYGDLQVDRYLQLSVASSRGCPFECSFCAETVFWNGFRGTPAAQLFAQLETLAQHHRRSAFYLCDSLANAAIGPLTTQINSSGRPYTIDCYLRADKSCVDAEKAARWRAGGLYRARLGMESASQRILDQMVKMTTPQLMSRSLQALSRNGIVTSTLWIVGYPGETEAEFQQTLDFIREHRNEIYQADAWLFQYHREGLANSQGLSKERGSRCRFNPRLNEILAVTPCVTANDMSAMERFDRLERFVATMNELGIPNPYGIFEWAAAERRWRELGRDAGWSIENSMVALNA